MSCRRSCPADSTWKNSNYFMADPLSLMAGRTRRVSWGELYQRLNYALFCTVEYQLAHPRLSPDMVLACALAPFEAKALSISTWQWPAKNP